MEHYRKWPKMIFIYLTKCQMALPSPSMENLWRTSLVLWHTDQLNKYCTHIDILVHENSNKNIIIDGTQSVVLFFHFSFPSENWPFRSLQAIRQHNKIKCETTQKKKYVFIWEEKRKIQNNRPEYAWVRMQLNEENDEMARSRGCKQMNDANNNRLTLSNIFISSLECPTGNQKHHNNGIKVMILN